MKKVFKLFGIVALVALIGFSMAGCDDGSGGGGGGGTFTITNIPSQYNGKYVSLSGHNNNNNAIYGYVPGKKTYPQISGGKVSIPLWTYSSGTTFVRYSGSDNNCIFNVSIEATSSGDGTLENYGIITSVKFSNGNATKSYNDVAWAY